MDIFMPEMNGVEATSIIRNRFPWMKIIILSVQTELAYVKKLFTMGVSGYITKNSPKEELFEAITTVFNGKEYLSKDIIQRKAQQSDSNGVARKHLSKREIEIIKLIQEGLTNKEISERMFISLKTVESHRTNIFRKLRIKNVAELLKYVHDNMMFNN
jgi:DNA-binding NarL/FixJ family response regulator